MQEPAEEAEASVPTENVRECPNSDRTTGRTGRWSEDEDIKLKDAVQVHGGKNWVAIAKLVPGRTKIQCHGRWKDVDPRPSTGRIDARVDGQKTKVSS
jgi:hypothetical protein